MVAKGHSYTEVPEAAIAKRLSNTARDVQQRVTEDGHVVESALVAADGAKGLCSYVNFDGRSPSRSNSPCHIPIRDRRSNKSLRVSAISSER